MTLFQKNYWQKLMRQPFLLFLLFGFVIRLLYIIYTPNQTPHSDFGSFLAPAKTLAHPFDTSPREPFFIWWLWLLLKGSVNTIFGQRLLTMLWFLPTLYFIHRLTTSLTGNKTALFVCFLYSVIPAQIESDTLALRHNIEVFGVVSFLYFAIFQLSKISKKNIFGAASSLALLCLTRINFCGSAGLLLVIQTVKQKHWKKLFLLFPTLFLLLFHFADNRKKYDDPLYSINYHTYWFANLEYIGHPGFPKSFEEWQKDSHKKSLTFKKWAFQYHTPKKFIMESTKGVFRCLWVFFEKIYFSNHILGLFKWLFLLLYIGGFILALFNRQLYFLTICLVTFILPYAFVSHVFWAGRFFVPFSPLVLILVTFAIQQGEIKGLSLFKRYFPNRKVPSVFPFLS